MKWNYLSTTMCSDFRSSPDFTLKEITLAFLGHIFGICSSLNLMVEKKKFLNSLTADLLTDDSCPLPYNVFNISII